MTTFTPIPRDLYRQAEPEAGEILPALTGRMKSHRPVEQFVPDWDYVCSGRASTIAVVSALHCEYTEVPEQVWPEVLQLYCPIAWRILTDAGITFEQWNTGRCDAVLCDRVAATANTELGGYAVCAVMDVPAAVAEIVTTLGDVPTVTGPGHSVTRQHNQ